MPVSEEEVREGAMAMLKADPVAMRLFTFDEVCDFARAALEAAEKVRESIAQGACKHLHKKGMGGNRPDGSFAMHWDCRDCGAAWIEKTPPRKAIVGEGKSE